VRNKSKMLFLDNVRGCLGFGNIIRREKRVRNMSRRLFLAGVWVQKVIRGQGETEK